MDTPAAKKRKGTNVDDAFESVVRDLGLFLDDQQTVNRVIQQMPHGWLSETQKANLRAFSQKFIPEHIKVRRSGAGGGGGGGARGKKKDKKTSIELEDEDEDEDADSEDPNKSSGSHPFAAIMRMSRPLELPTHLAELFDRRKPDAVKTFLYGEEDPRLSRLEQGMSTGDALLACYRYAQRLDPDNTIERYQRAFAMINMYDICVICIPQLSGKHLGKKQSQIVLDFLIRGGIDGVGEVDVSVVAKNIARYRRYGRKLLLAFVENFGIGSIFFLGHMLSDNFYEENLRISGKYYKEMKAHLEEVELSESIDLAEANPFGSRVREFLRAPYVRSYQAQHGLNVRSVSN